MTALWRALRLRCPWCASRRTFIRRWMGKYPRCRTCGIRWHREAGFELGPVVVNTVITFFSLAVAMTIGFVVTYPDVPIWPLVGWCMGIAIGLPVVIYPLTFTVWLAFDLLTHRPEAAELAEAAAAVKVSFDEA